VREKVWNARAVLGAEVQRQKAVKDNQKKQKGPTDTGRGERKNRQKKFWGGEKEKGKILVWVQWRGKNQGGGPTQKGAKIWKGRGRKPRERAHYQSIRSHSDDRKKKKQQKGGKRENLHKSITNQTENRKEYGAMMCVVKGRHKHERRH